MRKVFFSFAFLCTKFIVAQSLIHHTTNYFGPNANPVPDFTDARIPESTQLSIYGDYYFGHGDKTISNLTKIEIPIISEKISVKIWKVLLEKYSVTDEVKNRRGMQKNKGIATGDVYIQTRIKLLSEKEKLPCIILNSTLKTASGSDFKNRRFFNTAGYYFDLEMGKSFMFENSFIKELRVVSDLGFYSWDIQTPNLNVQDDAVMYGFKAVLKHKSIIWENTFSGYTGWIKRAVDYGDKPIVFASKIGVETKNKTVWFLQYQHGIRYFPFEQLRIGVQLPLKKLTPHFM